MCMLASASSVMVLSLMSEPSACHAFQFAFELAIAHIMVCESADPTTCLQGQGVILIVCVARDPASKRGLALSWP